MNRLIWLMIDWLATLIWSMDYIDILMDQMNWLSQAVRLPTCSRRSCCTRSVTSAATTSRRWASATRSTSAGSAAWTTPAVARWTWNCPPGRAGCRRTQPSTPRATSRGGRRASIISEPVFENMHEYNYYQRTCLWKHAWGLSANLSLKAACMRIIIVSEPVFDKVCTEYYRRTSLWKHAWG